MSKRFEGRFEGGPLANCSFEFDAVYYGTVHENQRAYAEWEERNAEYRAQLLAAGEVPEDLPRNKPLDTTEWITLLHLIRDAHSMPGTANPFKAINFNLDLHRALSKQKPSMIEVFTHFMDGYDLVEIAQMMGWTRVSARESVKQSSRSIRRHGDAILDAPTKRYLGVARTESAKVAEKQIERVRRSRGRKLLENALPDTREVEKAV